MLVCPSLSARLTSLTCLLAQSLGSAQRRLTSHLDSESEIQMEGAPSTELHQVPSADLHRLSPGDGCHVWRLLNCSARLLVEASGSLRRLGNKEARTAVIVRQALGMLRRARHRRELR